MTFDFSAVHPDGRDRERGIRIKFTMSRAQYEAAMLLIAEGIETSRQPRRVVEKAEQALGQMRRQDERQRAKKEQHR
ncbi:hypothetical protein [Dongia sp.]|uniref:hypothetical protein n=1 Tax=Dongia sp. TaxID=1977262 RepID=UPI0035AFCA8A